MLPRPLEHLRSSEALITCLREPMRGDSALRAREEVRVLGLQDEGFHRQVESALDRKSVV